MEFGIGNGDGSARFWVLDHCTSRNTSSVQQLAAHLVVLRLQASGVCRLGLSQFFLYF
jgi:hypothetical protein